VRARPTAFGVYIAFGLTFIAAYFMLPQTAQNLAFIASNLCAALVIFACARRRSLTPRRGWLLLASFPIATAIGNSIYFVNDSVLHVAPFPSVGDGFFLGAYLLLAAGLLRLQHARTAARDLPAWLDTAIITIGFGAASWVLFLAPVLHEDLSVLARLTALGYPVADVMVLAVAARFFLARRRRGPAFAVLAATVVAMLVADTAFAVLNLLGAYSTGHPIDALILSYNLGWGALALHPRADELSGAPSPGAARPTWWRLSALTVASLLAPTAVVAQIATGNARALVVTSVASALLFLLVVARMAGLVHQLERALAQRRSLAAELEYLVAHDHLTGLANRRMFTTELRTALEHHPGGGVTVLFLDLDRFKAVNDTMGHAAGDLLLQVTAARLIAALGERDVIARLGGDEFAVLLGEPAPDVSAVLATLVATLDRPVPMHGLDLQVTASIGAGVSRAGDSVEDLLHAADTAMYTDKTRVDRRRAETIPLVPAPRTTAA
jgi:diguanylate cyclase (GGDEF)-like protein